MPQTPPPVKAAGAPKPKAKLTQAESRAAKAKRSAANKAANVKSRPKAPAAPKASTRGAQQFLPGTNRLAADPLVDPKYTPLTPLVLQAFLAALSTTGNFTEVCEHLRLMPSSLQAERRKNPEFKAAWEQAMTDASDHWEAEIQRRAFQGTLKPVFQGGVMVGHVREYSDRLAEMMTRAYRPDRYKAPPTQVQQTVQGTMTNVNLTATLSPQQVDEELKARAQVLEALALGQADYKKAVAP